MKLVNFLKNKSWYTLLKNEFEEEYFKKLENTIISEYKDNLLSPFISDIFNALNLCSLSKLKVVIIGLDPYSNNRADGLAFSSKDPYIVSHSLRTLFNELYDNLKIDNNIGNLTKWSKQGVLLLNNILTIGKDRKHKHKGWKFFTDNIIDIINKKKQNIVFLLLGKETHEKADLINKTNNLVIKLGHPSPNSTIKTSQPIIGSKCFYKTNQYLEKHNIKKINWKL